MLTVRSSLSLASSNAVREPVERETEETTTIHKGTNCRLSGRHLFSFVLMVVPLSRVVVDLVSGLRPSAADQPHDGKEKRGIDLVAGRQYDRPQLFFFHMVVDSWHRANRSPEPGRGVRRTASWPAADVCRLMPAPIQLLWTTFLPFRRGNVCPGAGIDRSWAIDRSIDDRPFLFSSSGKEKRKHHRPTTNENRFSFVWSVVGWTLFRPSTFLPLKKEEMSISHDLVG